MALYLKKELENKAVIAVWKITETEEELKALSSTPTDEMEEISWIKSESMRKQRPIKWGRQILDGSLETNLYFQNHPSSDTRIPEA